MQISKSQASGIPVLQRMGTTLSYVDRYNATLHRALSIYKQSGMRPFNFNLGEITMIHAVHIAIGTLRWNAIIEHIFGGVPPPFHKDPVDGHYRLGLLLPIMTHQQQEMYGQLYWNLRALIWSRLTKEEQVLVQGVAMGATTVAQMFLYPILVCSSPSVYPPPGISYGLAPAPATPTGLSVPLAGATGTGTTPASYGSWITAATDDSTTSIVVDGPRARSHGPSPTASSSSSVVMNRTTFNNLDFRLSKRLYSG